MILGVGSFAHSIGRALKEAGAGVSTYLTRNYGHFPPALVGADISAARRIPVPFRCSRSGASTWSSRSPLTGRMQPWAAELIASGVGIFSPTGEAMRIERERDFARAVCARFKIPFPRSFVAANRLEAEKFWPSIPCRLSSRTRSVRPPARSIR